jgi:RNA polymerase sigma-70 factor, ECF subfamily
MRRVLVDHARARGALKRSGRETSIGEDLKTPTLQSDEDVIALDEALDTLKALSPRQSQVVELRYFGGLPSRKWRRCLG